MLDANIVRNQVEITVTVNNANMFLLIQKEFGPFDKHIWNFTSYNLVLNYPKPNLDVLSKFKKYDATSKYLI